MPYQNAVASFDVDAFAGMARDSGICMCVYTRIHVYMYTCTYKHTYVCIHGAAVPYQNAVASFDVDAFADMAGDSGVYKYVYVHIHIFINMTGANMYIHIHTFIQP